MSDIPITTRLYDADGQLEAASCSSGACSSPSPRFDTPRIVEQDDGWILNVSDTEIRHPVALTSNLARGLANIFVMETAREPSDVAAPLDVTVDITAVALGLGSLLLEGSYIYTKSCGGPSVAQLTALGLPDLAVVFVVFSQIHGHSVRSALSELGVTQRAAVVEANDWAQTQRPLIERLKVEPARFVEGEFELLQERGFLQRLFGRRQSSEELFERALDGELSTGELQRSSESRAKSKAPRDPARDELKALVNETLDAE
jgi:hypothetical protein